MFSFSKAEFYNIKYRTIWRNYLISGGNDSQNFKKNP